MAALEPTGSALWRAAPRVGSGDGRKQWEQRSGSRDIVHPFQFPFPFQMGLEAKQPLLDEARRMENWVVRGMELGERLGYVDLI